MAYQKLTPPSTLNGGDWTGRHAFTEFNVTSKYDAYVDPDKATNKPYLCLKNYRIMSTAVDRAQISDRAPFTIKIKIDDEEKEYTFNSGTSIKEYDTGVIDLDIGQRVIYYYVEFSSSTHIVLPEGGTAFTINTTITTKNEETYTFTEKACSPVSVKMSGPTEINTGAVSTYTLSATLPSSGERYSSSSTNKFYLKSVIPVYFPSQDGTSGDYAKEYDGFADAYTKTYLYSGNINEVRIAPIYTLSSPGEIGTPRIDSYGQRYNYVCVYYYYYTDDDNFGDRTQLQAHGNFWLNKILIATIYLGVKITSREEIDQDILPELEYAHNVGYYNTDEQHPHILKYGSYICGQSEYRWRVQYKMRYGNAIYAVDIDDYTSGSLKHTRIENPRNSNIYYSNYTYSAALNTVITNAAVNYTVEDMWGNIFTYSDSVTVIPYNIPAMTTARLQRCAKVSSGSGEGYYSYDGQTYHVDDYGDYCLVEWAINITPLNNQNSRYLTISDPASNSRSITLSSYTASGFYVVPADGEKSYDCKFTLRDDFKTTIVGRSLSTVMAIMDFLRVQPETKDPYYLTTYYQIGPSSYRADNVIATPGATIRITHAYYTASSSTPNYDYTNEDPSKCEMSTSRNKLYSKFVYTVTSDGETVEKVSHETVVYVLNSRGLQPSNIRYLFKSYPTTMSWSEISGDQSFIDMDGWIDDISMLTFTEDSYIGICAIISFSDSGGDAHGVAFGKVSELPDTLDIHRNWTLRMPMNIEIGNYYGNGQSVMLSTWMKNTVDRIQAIVDSRPYAIYKQGQFFDDYAASCVPSYGATIDMSSQTFKISCTGNYRAIMKVSKPVKINRQYIYFEFDSFSRSFASSSPIGDPQYYCKIYVLSTEPTTVDQYTGVPNGTVLTSLNVGALDWYGSLYDDGVQFWRIQNDTEWNKYLDVSRWMGQNVWIALSIASGVSAMGTYTENGYIWVRTIELTDDNGT